MAAPARERREIAFSDPATGIEAYLVVDASDHELSFGGMRVDEQVSPGAVSELSDNMSLKLAGQRCAVGGAKAGVRAAPDHPALRPFLRRFADRCRTELSSSTILGKDMGAQQWMVDEIYASLGHPQLEIARHRFEDGALPRRLCDLTGYVTHMTGRGVYWSLEQALEGSALGARVLVQGFGVVGAGITWHLARAGAQIIGVSDRDKSILRREGLDANVLLAARDEVGTILRDRLPASWHASDRDELVVTDADVLVLAAGSYVVDGALASRVRVPLVIEAANLALTNEALYLLHERGVRAVPDVVANSSSAALVARQVVAGDRHDPDRLWEQIEGNIRRNTDEALSMAAEWDVPPKLAFRRLVGVDHARGGPHGVI
jgi:glutamate dehydrogenase (NAD(P)+)